MELIDLFDDAELAFLDEVETFLDAWELEPRQYFQGRGGRNRELYRALGARGWLSMSWPEADGGGGRSIVYDYLVAAGGHERSAPAI